MADKINGWISTLRGRRVADAGEPTGEISAVIAAGMLVGVVLIVVGALLIRAGR